MSVAQKKIADIKKSKGANLVRSMMKNFSRNITVESLVDAALYTFLGWKSTEVFGKNEMFWYGPLAYKLARTPGGAGAPTISILGLSYNIPSSQQVGLMMFGAMGIITVADFLSKAAETKLLEIEDAVAEGWYENPPVEPCPNMSEDPRYMEYMNDFVEATMDIFKSYRFKDQELLNSGKTRRKEALTKLEALKTELCG